MVVTVTLNPSLDKSGVVPALVYDDVVRIGDMACMAGGKGVNVSRVLRNFGVKNIATGFAGGLNGKAFIKLLDREKIRRDFLLLRIDAETRANWTLLDEAKKKIIKLNEPGPEIRPDEAVRFLRKIARYVRRNTVFVVTGSLPAGLVSDYYEKLFSALVGKAKAVFWDSEVLPAMPVAKPDYIKPNVYEAERILKVKIRTDRDAVKALGLLKKYALHPFLSAGPKGLYLEDDGSFFRLSTPRLEHYAIPGAGDAFTAGFCMGLERSMTLMESAKWGVACAAATVATARFSGPEEAGAMLKKISLQTLRGQ